MNTSLNDRVCNICEKPGQLLQCSGGCLRSFHKECLGLSSIPSGRWRCSDCTKGEHRCFYCKSYAPDHKLIQCSIPNCRRYYHWTAACCGKDPKDTQVSSFVCPSHICTNCGLGDSSDNHLLKCIRCTKSYHVACFPPDIRKIDGRYISCASHRNENPTMPPQSTYFNHMNDKSMSRQPNMPYGYPTNPTHSPMAPSPLSGAPPAYYPQMNSPYMQQYPGYYPPPLGYPMPPQKRDSPSNPATQVKPVVKKIKRNLTDEQKAGKTLLSRWKDLRRAGIEIKEEKIKQRSILLANVKEKALAQEKNTLKLRETMGLYN